MFEKYLNELPVKFIAEYFVEYVKDGNIEKILSITPENLEKINIRSVFN